MLSVLIPVKDWNPHDLADLLANQLIQSGIPYEILVSDDSAPEMAAKTSEELEPVPGVKYFFRDTPLGRSANRNFLAANASYEYLLFIDGDAGHPGPEFIRNYLDHLSDQTVLCGGTLYTMEPPDNQEFLLRWKYGRAREQNTAAKRQKHPWKSFSTFNFLIPAKIYRNILFDESIKGYGHEDTLFGIHLHQAGINILHLDNGLFHLGLEPATLFLEKVRESGANLRTLHSRDILPPANIRDMNLLSTWIWLERLRISRLIAAWFRFRRKNMERQLCGPHPSMLLLDLYKLGSISHIG